MYKNYGKPRAQYNSSGDNKNYYALCNHMESQSGRITKLTAAIRDLQSDLEAIFEMLKRTKHISRDYNSREYSLPHGSRDKRQINLLQDSSSSNEGERICKDKANTRRRMVDIHEQGETINGRVTSNQIAYNLADFDRIMSETNKEKTQNNDN